LREKSRKLLLNKPGAAVPRQTAAKIGHRFPRVFPKMATLPEMPNGRQARRPRASIWAGRGSALLNIDLDGARLR
jgi:hypothetical protein